MSTCELNLSVFDELSNDAVTGLREVTAVAEALTERESVSTETPSDGLENKCPDDDKQQECSLAKEPSQNLICSACRCPFINREEQVEHYKLDWHLFNLKRKMTGLPPVTVEDFEKKTGAGDLSSISGSESDSEDSDSDVTQLSAGESSSETSSIPGRLSSKVVLQNSAGQYLAVYRCILQGKKSEGEQDVALSLKSITQKTVWVILMTGGGHFAGAVFQGKNVLHHKTLHRYTVRAKCGTAQGLRDAKNGCTKSAGSALRRYNEAALVKDIQYLLLSWAEHLKEASAIFIRAPSYNKTIFFGGRTPLLAKRDSRIRTLPFPTRRATFHEVQRVHELLSTIQLYGKDTDMSVVFSPTKKVWKKPINPTVQISSEEKAAAADCNPDSSDKDDDGLLEMVELTLTTLDLRESEVQPSRRKRRNRRKKDEPKIQNEELRVESHDEEAVKVQEDAVAEDKPPETQSKQKRKPQSKKQMKDTVDESWEYGLRDVLFTACKVGDVDTLFRLLQLPEETADCPQGSEGDMLNKHSSGELSPLSLLNKPIDSSGFTLLHVASAAAQKAAVRLLMDAGADPACRDNKGQTPYIVAPDKDTRNVFRKYMGENLDKYDYSKAQVPGPLTAEIESKQKEKKKAQKALRKQRIKEQKEEDRKQELEAEEKKRFASLTDREKRALAAERRLAEQVAAAGVGISNTKRCWMCGESLLGKIPFHYLDYSFCTPRCVQAHRKANTPPAKT
ncbi:ankyrin repeat and zinc finger domain-containing protein 1 isoform X2 [Thalassophryne amazonica]|uniref:ankyrin repeat and zinc finger domain-containing protein 1 isoform X2 n=1 Tax=Thalassophryne amazonica TaxID=390379 RepID=UPI00147265B6|nr:ankyrin repeat and zinc finger domain-containing protein 1 isoform X2 [Thalassophryne amazonica]